MAALLLAAALILMLPALLSQHVLSGDSHIHILWQSYFAETFWDGTLYPRWLPELNHGFGSPVFFIYPSLVQWTGALFAPVFPGPSGGMTRMAIALWLVSAAGALGAYRWLRGLGTSAAAAALGAGLFLLMPYRAYFDIYQRGAPAELTGISVMPWLLCFAHGIKARRPGAWGGFALAVGAILYSHLPAAEMGLLLAAGYVLVIAERSDWIAFFVRVGAATMIGIAIAGLCLGPALTLVGLLIDDTNLFGALHQPMNWLVFGPRWDDPGIQIVATGLVALTLVLAAVLLPLALGRRAGDAPLRRRIAWYLGGVTLAVVLLNTQASEPFWALQTPLSRIQFPFRLLSLPCVALAGLGALAWDRFAARRPLRLLLLAALPGLLLVDATLLGLQRMHGRTGPPPDIAAILTDTRDSNEYVLASLERLEARFGTARTWVVAGDARATVVRWRSRDIAIDVDARTPARIALRQFAFSGWDCRIDGGAWARGTALPPPYSVAACTVPAGHHRVEARLAVQAGEYWGGWATPIGLAIALAEIAAAVLRRSRARPADRPLVAP